MINNNKILTVSYGTFSCTLEGFDDSFGTMKAIAEYFRDLSADDRYFGAEPAQPDAQMLARIAEREISRHVEARQDKGRIVLSAQDSESAADDAPAALEKPAVAEEAKSEKPAKAKPAPRVIKKVGTPMFQAKPSAETPEAEQEVVQTAPEAAATPASAEDAPVAQDDTAAEAVIVPSLPDEDVKAFFADAAPASADQADTDDAEDAPVKATTGQAQAGSIADKLSRIRAVVSQQSDTDEAPDFSEDQHADASVAPSAKMTDNVADLEDEAAEDEETDVLADTLRDLEDALDTDDQSEAPSAAHDDATEESEDDDIAAILSRLDAEAEDFEDPAPEAELEQDTSADLASDADDADTDDMDENILAAIGAETVNPGLDDLDDLPKGNIFEDAPAASPAEEASTEEAPEPEVVKPAPRTRVLKVKRATLDAAIESGKLEEYDDGQDASAAAASASSLSPEAEAELADELAALEADMKATDAAAQQAEEAAAQDPQARDMEEAEAEQRAQESAAARAKIKSLADDDLSRLMEESESKMEEPEAATRRDAFSHLRAAVASKKADEAAGGASDDVDTDEAYRDDLASVVRPRRPVASGSERPRTQRPAEPQPAPLKLVAEQRIDLDQPRSAAPVRPRRVSAMAPKAVPTSAAQAAGADSFADFAAEMGATQLPDLLEAAAAYLSFVEGLDEFSRPQLMTKVRQVEQENFTREDSLRSFGKLLREGKIEKLKGGRFQASELIGFKPDARATG